MKASTDGRGGSAQADAPSAGGVVGGVRGICEGVYCWQRMTLVALLAMYETISLVTGIVHR